MADAQAEITAAQAEYTPMLTPLLALPQSSKEALAHAVATVEAGRRRSKQTPSLPPFKTATTVAVPSQEEATAADAARERAEVQERQRLGGNVNQPLPQLSSAQEELVNQAVKAASNELMAPVERAAAGRGSAEATWERPDANRHVARAFDARA